MQYTTNQVSTTVVIEPRSVKASVKKAQRPIVEMQVHRVNLVSLIQRQSGKFIGVTYQKKDFSYRMLNGRLGVKCYLKGGANNVQADDRSYLTVYDMKAKGYRTVDLATVMSIRCDRTVYIVIG